MERHTAFYISGGAGRIICAIPALELYASEHPEDDFIIVVEHGMDFFRGHPDLYKRCYDFSHKNLFLDKIKDRDFFNPEPYQLWEYYNQKCSISQAFDIIINNKGIRDVINPRLFLTNEEYYGGLETVRKIRSEFGDKKTIVFQPWGRGSNLNKNITSLDPYGKSFFIEDAVKLIEKLQKKYTVILMSENEIDLKQFGYNDSIAQITNLTLRRWASIISSADYFLGCDSVGQHMAYAFDKKATVVLGSTFAINVSYPNNPKFDILDFGKDKKMYSPIRVSIDDVADVNNEGIMRLNEDQLDEIVKSIDKNI